MFLLIAHIVVLCKLLSWTLDRSISSNTSCIGLLEVWRFQVGLLEWFSHGLSVVERTWFRAHKQLLALAEAVCRGQWLNHWDFCLLIDNRWWPITLDRGKFQAINVHHGIHWPSVFAPFILPLRIVIVKLAYPTPSCSVDHFLRFVDLDKLAIDIGCLILRSGLILAHLPVRHTWTCISSSFGQLYVSLRILKSHRIDLLDGRNLLLWVALNLHDLLAGTLAPQCLLLLLILEVLSQTAQRCRLLQRHC